MTWDNITVEQFQKLAKVFEAHQKGEDETEVDFQTLLVCYNLTEEQGSLLTTGQYKEMMRKLWFVNNQEMKFAPVKTTRVGDTRYKFIYDVRRLQAHRFIEATTFEGRGMVENMHRIAASMAVLQKKVWYGWKDVEYNSADHDLYAADFLKVPITHVYGSVVFFCKVFTGSIKNLKSYLKTEMMRTGKTEEEVESALTHLCSLMDGVSRPLR